MNPKPENFPAELKTKPNWVAWRKQTKVPVNPRNLDNAKSNNPTTWGTIAEALKAVQNNPGRIGGVGINPVQELVVVDFDDVCPGGKLSDEVLDAITKTGSYWEFSPSGNGLKGLFFAKAGMGYLNIPKKKVRFHGIPVAEVWNDGKYTTLTGNLVKPELNKIQLMDGFVDALVVAMRKQQTETTTTPPPQTQTSSGGGKNPPPAERDWTEAEVRQMLNHVSADVGNDDWVRIGMALKTWDPGERGRAVFVNWSATAPNRFDDRDANTRWNSFSPQGNGAGRVTLGTLVHLAKQGGFSDCGAKRDPQLKRSLPICSSIKAPQLDPFPIEVFPDAVRMMVEDVAKVARTPVELAGPIALGVLSGCIGKGLVVKQAFGGNDALPTIQVCIFAPSGSGKSATTKPFTKKLNEWIFQQKEDIRLKSTKLKARAEFIEATIQRNVKAYAKEPSANLILENETYGTELAEIQAQLKGTEFLVEDVTPERLAVVLGNNGANGQECVFSLSLDARKAVAVVLGCYKKEHNSPDDTLYVKTFSWDPHNQQRQGNERSVDLKAPALPLLWLMQPDLADKLLGHPELMASGFIQRLTMDRIHNEPSEILEPVLEDATARKGWDRLVFQVLERFRTRNQPLEIDAGEGVREMMLGYYNENIRRIRTGELADVESLAVRFAEMAWRFALILHVARHGEQAEQPLEAVSAKNGIVLARYYANRKLALMLASRDKRDQDKIERVGSLIDRWGHVTARKLSQFLHELSTERWRDWLEKKALARVFLRTEVTQQGGGPRSVQFSRMPTTNATNATNETRVERS